MEAERQNSGRMLRILKLLTNPKLNAAELVVLRAESGMGWLLAVAALHAQEFATGVAADD